VANIIFVLEINS